MTPAHIRLVESHARLAAAVRLLLDAVDGTHEPVMPRLEMLEAARDLIAQSEEWMGRSDDEVRGVVEGPLDVEALAAGYERPAGWSRGRKP